jgi:parallel beta-helix repeat protein
MRLPLVAVLMSMCTAVLGAAAGALPTSGRAAVTAPSAAFITPSSGATVSGTVAVAATATDPSGISSVELLVDGTVSGFDSTAPYTWSWITTTVPDGIHYLQIRAYDSSGNLGSSNTIPVTVANSAPAVQGPSVAFSIPSAGATVSGAVPVVAAASAPAGISDVQLIVDGTVAGSDSTAPYSWSWVSSTVPDGTHYLQIRAYDTAGRLGSSNTIAVTVANAASADSQAPTVSLLTPSAGATVAGNVTVAATASDNVGVGIVQLIVDGAVAGSDSTAPYSWAWDTTSLPDGTHYVQIRAYDANGNLGSSNMIAVTVSNASAPTQGPTVSLSSPSAGATLSGTVSVIASASSAAGIGSVQLVVDGAVAGTDTTAPYTWGWDTTRLADGVHYLQILAYDTVGRMNSSSTVSVTLANGGPAPGPGDTQGPTVSLSTPAAGATVSGTVSVVALASDNLGVSNVQLLVDGTVAGSDSTAPYAWGWITTGLPDGTHYLQARAYDAAGNLGSSSTITVTVLNAAPTLGGSSSCSGVPVFPSQSLQAAVDANPGGTTFCLKAGIQRVTVGLVAKAGDSFIGEPGAVVSGAKDISNLFTQSGGYWVASGQSQYNTSSTGVCNPGFDLCASANDVFFDNKPLIQVGSLSALTPGHVFFDHSAQRIYLADNPAGHTIEAAVATRAFRGDQTTATNVRIQGLVIEKCANEASSGAIIANSGWVIVGNEVRLNHGIGVQGGALINGNNIHDNGQLGISIFGDSNVVVQNNTIAYNNYAGYGTSWEAGGGKFIRTTSLTVRGNYVHDNLGIGIGSDSDNIYTIYDNNRVENNAGAGITVETSYDTLIKNNTVRGNGSAFTGGLAGAGIYLNTSQNVEIEYNTVDRNLQGIGIFTANRGSGAYGPYQTANDNVHDNTIVLLPGAGTGITSDNLADYTTNNNRFQYNHYYLCGAAYFAVWNGVSGYKYTNYLGWIAAGFDTNGTFTGSC